MPPKDARGLRNKQLPFRDSGIDLRARPASNQRAGGGAAGSAFPLPDPELGEVTAGRKAAGTGSDAETQNQMEVVSVSTLGRCRPPCCNDVLLNVGIFLRPADEDPAAAQCRD